MSTHTVRLPLAIPSTNDDPAWLDRSLYPFQSRFVDIDGSRVHYIDEGRGPVLLFLHANLVWSFTYRYLIQGLRSRFRCIALDYPGYGLSTPAPGYGFSLPEHSRIVERFMQTLELRETTLFVHDAGGPIGLPVAVAHPEWFRALILADTFAWPLQDYPDVARFVGVVASRPFRFVNRQTNLLLQATVRFGTRSRTLSPSERAALLGPFKTRSARDRIGVLFQDLIDRRDHLAALERGLNDLHDTPVLLIYGEQDPARKAGFLARFETTFPHHHSLVVAGAGHFTHEDAPDAVVAAIDAWWPEKVAGQPAASSTGSRADVTAENLPGGRSD